MGTLDKSLNNSSAAFRAFVSPGQSTPLGSLIADVAFPRAPAGAVPPVPLAARGCEVPLGARVLPLGGGLLLGIRVLPGGGELPVLVREPGALGSYLSEELPCPEYGGDFLCPKELPGSTPV